MQQKLKSLQEEVLSMRFLMKKNGKSEKYDLVDIKHDKGGLIDIEFLIQYVILANASRYPKLCENMGNFAACKVMADLQLLPASLTENFWKFVRYREWIHKNDLTFEN